MKLETITITCDMCRLPEAEELRYAVMGREYAIDLCSQDRAIFDNLMADFIGRSHIVTYRNHTVRRDRARSVPVVQDEPPSKPARRKKAATASQTS